jgi:transposase
MTIESLVAQDLMGQPTPAVDKMAQELRTAKIPQGIICPECRGEIKDQGKYREAIEIDVHPSRFVKRTVNLHKGSCRCGGATLRMPAPIRATEGSKFSPRFVSRLALDKFDMSLPLYRQRRMMSYEGLDLDRSTLNRAVERHSVFLGSLVQRIHELNLKEDYLNVDESPLRHFEGGQRKTSFLFSFVSHKAVSCQTQYGRNRKIVADLIGSGPGVLQTDGLNIYENKVDDEGHPVFHRIPGIHDHDVARVVDGLSRRVVKYLRKLGKLSPHGVEVCIADQSAAEDLMLSHLKRASISSRIALGPRSGLKVRRIGGSFGYEEEIPKNQGYGCASKNGFSIHAATSIKAHERDRLEQLLRYLGRGPVAHDKMSLDQHGNILYELKKSFDGATHVLLSPAGGRGIQPGPLECRYAVQLLWHRFWRWIRRLQAEL